MSDEELCTLVTSKLSTVKSVSYTNIALHADKVRQLSNPSLSMIVCSDCGVFCVHICVVCSADGEAWRPCW